MPKGRRNAGNPGMMPVPADWREALQWFVNTYALYYGSTRGLFLSDWTDEQAVSLEAAVINLRTRGYAPFVATGETIYQQADFIYNESRGKVAFGRPLASQLELELSGNDVVIIDGLEAPEKASQLWYLMYYLFFPRAIAGKVTILTTQLSYEEFVRYGRACPDTEFLGSSFGFEKLLWLMESCTISQDLFKQVREESLPPMLKAEYHLYCALRERGLELIPQHVMGDYLLDFAMVKGDERLNIECDILSALAGQEINIKEAKRDATMLADGWQILKFSTSEIMNNTSACADVVEDTWRGGRRRSQCGRLLGGKSLPTLPELPEDEVQRSAILFGGGPIALVGGSGTGKTLSLVNRVAFLLSQGVSPDNILVLSYSADSARMLKNCFDGKVDKHTVLRLSVMCWHDLGMRILRENLPAIKRKPPLKIEPSPQKVIQKLITKLRKDIDPVKLEMAGELDEFYVSAVIAMYKAHLVSVTRAKDEAQGDAEEIIARLYQSYEDQLLKANRIDKNDVSALAVQVLLDNAEVRTKYQANYEFILVDEFQDVTVAQDMLVRILAAPQDNLFVTGDEDETISESSNACPELLADFSFRFPNARTVVMEHNWRCHPAIIEHARWTLAYLERRKIQKDFLSAWGSAPNAAIFGPQPCINEAEECAWIAHQAKALVDAGRDAGHIAILYRQHQYETLLEAELLRCGVRFLASQADNSIIPDEVGDMIAFLKLVMDPDGPRAREAFERVSQLGTKEIDPKLSATIASFAGANNLSYLKAVEIYAEATADSSCRELEQLVRIIRAMNQDKLPPYESIGYLRRTRRLNDYYKSIKIPPGTVYEPLKKLSNLESQARNFSSVSEFVQHVEERLGEDDDKNEVQAIYVKSVQDVKGFDFPIVFLAGLADGLMPLASTQDMEEERRLFYVAFTRAREALYLTFPVRSGDKDLGPSRFLLEARLVPESGMQIAPALLPVEKIAVGEQQQFGIQAPGVVPTRALPSPPSKREVTSQPKPQVLPATPAPVPLAAESLGSVPAAVPIAPDISIAAPVLLETFQGTTAMQQPAIQQAAAQQAHIAANESPQASSTEYNVYGVPIQHDSAEEIQQIEPQAAVQIPPQHSAPLQNTYLAAEAGPNPVAIPNQSSENRRERFGPNHAITNNVNQATAAQEAPSAGITNQANQLAATQQASQLAAPQQVNQLTAAQQAGLAAQQAASVAPPKPPALPKLPGKGNAKPLATSPGVANQHPAAAAYAENAEYSQPVSTSAPVTPAPSVAPGMIALPPTPATLQDGFAGFGQSAEDAAEETYAEYRALQAKAGGPVRDEPTAGDPYYAQKEKVSGLSPYTGLDLGEGSRDPGYLPPAKTAQAPAAPGEQAEDYPVAPTTAPARPQNFSLVPPLPPPTPKNGLFPPAARRDAAPPETPQQEPALASYDYSAAANIAASRAQAQQISYPEQTYEQAEQEAPPSYEGMPICASCGNSLEVNARFCGECGYSLPERIQACTGCGLALEPGAKFCGECGTPAPVAPAEGASPDPKGKGWINKFLK